MRIQYILLDMYSSIRHGKGIGSFVLQSLTMRLFAERRMRIVHVLHSGNNTNRKPELRIGDEHGRYRGSSEGETGARQGKERKRSIRGHSWQSSTPTATPPAQSSRSHQEPKSLRPHRFIRDNHSPTHSQPPHASPLIPHHYPRSAPPPSLPPRSPAPRSSTSPPPH